METTNETMKGRVCLITGATAGIGREAAFQLARMGATLVLAGRNEERCVNTVALIKEQTGNASVEYLVADLSVQSEVKRLAQEFQSRHGQLHVLLNNAGVINLQRMENADGIEMTFALNHLGYFVLTLMLLDTLKASAPARIVNVSSDAHRGISLNLDDLQGRSGYGGFGAYSRSKLANIMFTYQLAARLAGSGVTVNALHPGLVATNFLSGNGIRGKFLRFFLALKGMSPERGAGTSVFLASSPDVEAVSGLYFVKSQPAPSSPQSYDEETAKALWQASLQITELADLMPLPTDSPLHGAQPDEP
ncbi:MAG: short-chain dehydrogenase [SAR202 cluster bacterium Io17-Chloro-G2]|nr:MAG: short-chain dehydrogenase [SAR202 cluster bacterium Io17-Chloro-G2]